MDGRNGLINVLIGVVGVPPQPFLTSNVQAMPAILALVLRVMVAPLRGLAPPTE